MKSHEDEQKALMVEWALMLMGLTAIFALASIPMPGVGLEWLSILSAFACAMAVWNASTSKK